MQAPGQVQQGSGEGSGEGLRGFGAEPGQVQQGCGEGSGEGLGGFGAESSQVQRVLEKVAEAKPSQVHLTNGNPAEVFPALGFAARFKKICKHKTLRLLGVPPKLIFIKGSLVGETSVLRTFRMSKKQLVKETVSQRNS